MARKVARKVCGDSYHVYNMTYIYYTIVPILGVNRKSVTLLPCPEGRTTKSIKDMWWHWGKKNIGDQVCDVC